MSAPTLEPMTASLDVRRQRLAQAIAAEVARGALIESQTETTAFLFTTAPKKINHVLHLILTILTGVWLFVWIYLALSPGREQHRVMLTVDEWGHVLRQQLT